MYHLTCTSPLIKINPTNFHNIFSNIVVTKFIATAVPLILEPIIIARSLQTIPTYTQHILLKIYASCPYCVNPAEIRNTPATARNVATHFTYQSVVPVGVVGVSSSFSCCSSASCSVFPYKFQTKPFSIIIFILVKVTFPIITALLIKRPNHFV